MDDVKQWQCGVSCAVSGLHSRQSARVRHGTQQSHLSGYRHVLQGEKEVLGLWIAQTVGAKSGLPW